MNLKNQLYIFFLTVMLSKAVMAQEQVKKIEILSSNNEYLVFNNNYQKTVDSISSKGYEELRAYVTDNLRIEANGEPSMFFELMSWVNQQWKHDGWNAAPDSLTSLEILKNAKYGVQYRCVEYGKVLKDVLLSFGYISRTIGLKQIDAAYGCFGMGHVATEVWSNNLKKWILLDPQFNTYAKYHDKILNIYEIYELKQKGLFSEIEFINALKNKNSKDYADFIVKYLGFLCLDQIEGKNSYILVLQMEGKDDFLTFQSLPSGKNIFTKNVDLAYYDINKTMVIIDYPEEDFKKSLAKIQECRSKEDYYKKQPEFAAKPNFNLSILNNMPWFKKYEVNLNGENIKTDDTTLSISLSEGVNELKIYAINEMEVKGVPTILKIKYE